MLPSGMTARKSSCTGLESFCLEKVVVVLPVPDRPMMSTAPPRPAGAANRDRRLAPGRRGIVRDDERGRLAARAHPGLDVAVAVLRLETVGQALRQGAQLIGSWARDDRTGPDREIHDGGYKRT